MPSLTLSLVRVGATPQSSAVKHRNEKVKYPVFMRDDTIHLAVLAFLVLKQYDLNILHTPAWTVFHLHDAR